MKVILKSDFLYFFFSIFEYLRLVDRNLLFPYLLLDGISIIVY